KAAQWLADEWATTGYHTTPESIRARYNVLKKARKALEEEEALLEHVKDRV
ncbi:MAG: hypothetical protein GWN58_18165, partial [Anaerolineae bacterium]|nr:hypothetical protein [Anaerolineae bacterium]